MPKTVEYTGAQRGWSELAATGKQSVWFPGQAEERSDSEAALLLATGLFKSPDDTLTAADVAATKSLVSADRNLQRVDAVPTAVSGKAGAWTFSRASANASVLDCFGSLQFALSGEMRLRGWRRVCNLLRFPENLLNTTYWNNSPPANVSIAAAGIKPPKAARHQRSSCTWTVTRTSGAAVMLTYTAASYRPGKYIFPMWIMGDGVQTYTLAIGAGTQTVTPEAGVWTPVDVVANITSTSPVALTVTNATSGAASFKICCPMIAWAHGESAPVRPDYVPRDVVGYPAALLGVGYRHDDGGYSAGVDGVRYYPTYSRWVRNNGISTPTAVVRPIDPSVLDGVMVEPISTCGLFDSRDISAASWAKSGSTVVNATAGDCAYLGIGSLRKIEEVAASSAWRVTQSWQTAVVGSNPADGAAMTITVPFQVAERSIAYIGLRQKDGATFTYSFFDGLTGQTAGVTAGNNATLRREGDVWLATMTGPVGSGSTAPLIQVGMTTSVAQHINAYLGTAGAGLWVGAIQWEVLGCGTSYMGDTPSSASVLTRQNDALSVTLTDCPAIDFTMSFAYTPLFATDTGWKDGWWFICSAYPNTITPDFDRNAIGLRPNAFGGAGAGMEDEWFIDLYPGNSDAPDRPNSTLWDGVELKDGSQNLKPGETVTIQWALHPTGQTTGTSSYTGTTGTTNQVGRIGNSAMPLTGDSRRPAVNQLRTVPRTYHFGRQAPGMQQRGSFCVKDFGWLPRALTASEMVELAP